MTTIYDTADLEVLRRRNAVQPNVMKCFRNALFKHARNRDEALATLPAPVRESFSEQVRFDALHLLERHDSAIDGASKLVFRTDDGYLIESVVLRPQTGRTTVCISSQVGCSCYCSFCATGQMGFTRNLTKAEILDQVARTNRMIRAEGRSVRNVVFMGMGEPLLNLENVCQAVEFLMDVRFFNLSGARITVSTVGIPSVMESFAERYPEVQLALSLHSARQEVRQRLMPLARRYPLERLRETLTRIGRNGPVMIEYLMIEGINDSEADLEALEEYLRGLSVHVNIIPFNEFTGSNLRGSAKPERERFARRLKEAGFKTTLRYSLGADIAAACGQLVKHRKEAVHGTG